MLKKLPYARTDDTAALSGHVYISHFWRDSGGTVHHTSVMSCVYFLVGRIFHPQTQLTFLTKEWDWRKSTKPIITRRENSKVLKKRHYAPTNDTEALSSYVYVYSPFLKRFRRYSSPYQRNVMCLLFGGKDISSTNSAYVSNERVRLEEIPQTNY